MSSLISRSDQSHWYTRDGQPAYTQPCKKTGGVRSTSLTDARKLGLLPSVTTVMKLLAKPAVEDWRVEQAIAMTLQKAKEASSSQWHQWWDGQDDMDRIEQIGQALDTDLQKARTFGTLVHAGVEHVSLHHELPKSMTETGNQLAPVLPWIESFARWKQENLETIYSAELVITHTGLGYAGRIDLHVRHKTLGDLVVDCKTQSVKKRPVFYPEWSYQLAAYREAILSMAGRRDIYPQGLSLVIDSNPVQSGLPKVYEKLWTPEETSHGWEVFKSLLQLWKVLKKYDPCQLTGQPVTTGNQSSPEGQV